jgi:putative membrane protein
MALAAVPGMAWAGWWWVWWVVWVVIIILAVAWWTPLGGRTRIYRETPLEILRRRLANGEITTQEYEEKRALLLRDHGERGGECGGERGPRGGQAA